jgi:anti-sigma regulatory factor (Ser/Thr protein kinase)
VLPVMVGIDDPSRVAEARRHAMTAAREEGMDEAETGQVGIVATEAATNLLKHARYGQLYISRLSDYGDAGVEILSIDRGPGIPDLDRCLADGYSTSGTPGTGLGAMVRLSREFDAYSQMGRGSVLVARNFPKGNSPVPIGAITVPFPGESVCGDAWCVRRNGHRTTVLVADGLGHGVLASDASTAAKTVFQHLPETSPSEMLEAVHHALRGTRGAAVAVAFIETEPRRVRYAGLGNISGVILGGPKAQYMLSHNGTAGHQARRFQDFEYALPPSAVVVMHSDGLATSWSLDSYPGLLRRKPSLIAGILYRDANRGRDDVCVMAIQCEDT